MLHSTRRYRIVLDIHDERRQRNDAGNPFDISKPLDLEPKQIIRTF